MSRPKSVRLANKKSKKGISVAPRKISLLPRSELELLDILDLRSDKSNVEAPTDSVAKDGEPDKDKDKDKDVDKDIDKDVDKDKDVDVGK